MGQGRTYLFSMFTILTRTSNRPNFYAECLRSIQAQTLTPAMVVSRDDPEDTYMFRDSTPICIVVNVDREPGRGHNLYFNTMRYYVPNSAPWVIHLDDDDRFAHSEALERIADAITDEDDLILWRVKMPFGRIIPDRIGERPRFGECTGIGFAVHVRHWHPWQAVAGGDFLVIDHYYRTLNPVWIDEVLTEFQAGPGGGSRTDKTLL